MVNVDYIPVINKEEHCKVKIENVLMIEHELRRTIIYTENGKFWLYCKISWNIATKKS